MLLSAEKNDNDAIVLRYFEKKKKSIVFKQIVIDLSE